MSSKPTKRLFDMNGIRVSFFVAGFIFTYVQIYFSGALTGGGGGRSPHRPGVDLPLHEAEPATVLITRPTPDPLRHYISYHIRENRFIVRPLLR